MQKSVCTVRCLTTGHRIWILLAVILMTACHSGTENRKSQESGRHQAAGNIQKSGQGDLQAIYDERDRELLEQFLDQLTPFSGEPTGLLLARTGKLFLGTPYVAHTLERDDETLVVNLRELDCTTYAENCLAIARTVQSGTPSFDRFLEELQLIRYRDGQLNGYPSRLHYFCDWIYNNTQKGLLMEPDAELGGKSLSKEINFMSTHPQEYRQLANDTALVEILREQEGRINAREMLYIPEGMVGEVEDRLKDGDIVGITTDIEGLAVMHVGILVRIDGHIHLMHASSSAGKVVVSEGTLSEYLTLSQRATGIMVARPI
jgi:hypothetical protein